MTSLHASPDRRFADAALEGNTDVVGAGADAANSDTSTSAGSPADRRTFRASSLQEAIDAATIELGGDVTVLEANRIRRGGLGGFFATDLGVEVIVTRSTDASRRRTADSGATNAVDRLLGRFDERDGDRFTPSSGSDMATSGRGSAIDRAMARGRRLGADAVGPDGFDTPSTASTAPTISMDRRSLVFDDDVVFEFDDDAEPVTRAPLAATTADDAPADLDGDAGAHAGADARADLGGDVRADLDAGAQDVVAPVEPARHPFADLLEQELRSMTGEAAVPRLGNETDLVTPPLDSPAPIVAPVTSEAAPTLDSPDEPDAAADSPNDPPAALHAVPADVHDGHRDGPRALDELPVMNDGVVEGTVDGSIAGALDGVLDAVETVDLVDEGAFDPHERSAEDALADLDALLASAGIDVGAAPAEATTARNSPEPFDDDPTPTHTPRPAGAQVATPASAPTTDMMLDLTDRLADQLSTVDRLASNGDGLRRMQVKISTPDGSLVEMQAEWGERG